MVELRDAGTTIIMSTHMMRQIEELCDRILLIDQGRNELYGNLAEIRRAHRGHAVLVSIEGELPALAGVTGVVQRNGALLLTLAEQASPQHVLQQLIAQQTLIERFEIAAPTLDEIFIRAVGIERAG